MKFSIIGLKDHSTTSRSRPDTSHTSTASAPATQQEVCHQMHRIPPPDGNVRNSSVYQLMAKRKFAEPPRPRDSWEEASWKRKRARREAQFGFEATTSRSANENVVPARESRSHPYPSQVAAEGEGVRLNQRRYSGSRCLVQSLPPLEPILIPADTRNECLHNINHEELEVVGQCPPYPSSKNHQGIPVFRRKSAACRPDPNASKTFESRQFERRIEYFSRSAGKSADPECYPSSNHSGMARLSALGEDIKEHLPGSRKVSGVSDEICGFRKDNLNKQLQLDVESRNQFVMTSSAVPTQVFLRDGESSVYLHRYHRPGQRALMFESQAKKQLERDRFYENVDNLLKSHRHFGEVFDKLTGILPQSQHFLPPGTQSKSSTRKEQIHRNVSPSLNNSLKPQTKVELPVEGQLSREGFWVQVGGSCQQMATESAAKKMEFPSRMSSDENGLLTYDPSGDSMSLISAALRRLGRGRFGVLECLNNFTQKLVGVEKQRKAFRQEFGKGRMDPVLTGSRSSVEIAAEIADSKIPRVPVGEDSSENAPLDLTTTSSAAAGSLQDSVKSDSFKDDDSSCGSCNDSSAAAATRDSVRLPIKKRMTMYLGWSSGDVVAGKMADGGTAQGTYGGLVADLPGAAVIEQQNVDPEKLRIAGDSHVTPEKRLKILIQTPDEDGNLPLHLSVLKDDLEVTFALVREMNLRNMSLDRYNHLKQTPLHLAITKKNLSIIRVLLQGSASCNVPDKHGNNAVHLAIKMENMEIFESICTESLVLVDVSAVNCDGMTILDLARTKNLSPSHVKLLTSQRIGCNNNVKFDAVTKPVSIVAALSNFQGRWHLVHQKPPAATPATGVAVASMETGNSIRIRQPEICVRKIKEALCFQSSSSSPPTPSESPMSSPSVASLALALSPLPLNSPPPSPSTLYPYRAPLSLSRSCPSSSSSASSASPAPNSQSYAVDNSSAVSLCAAC